MDTTAAIWQQHAENSTPLSKLGGVSHADVVIVGAGITGLTAALWLQEAGKNVIVMERHQVCSGVSGRNSGHLTSILLDERYYNIVSSFGDADARMAAQSQVAAIDWIESLVTTHQIDCDFARIPGYLFAADNAQAKILDKEARAIATCGIAFQPVEQTPLPFPTEKAIRIADQARMNPYLYCQALAKLAMKAGARIVENAPVLQVKDRTDGCEIKWQFGTIQASHVILATHTPVGLWPMIQTRLEPLRSYIVIATVRDEVADAFYWDMQEPYHYIRVLDKNNGETTILVGGADHPTGNADAPQASMQTLVDYVKSHFDVVSIDYRWSAQLYHPADGLPYIGPTTPNSHQYVATGFAGEGLTCGTLAAKILTDRILERRNLWSELFAASRQDWLKSKSGLLSENVRTMSHFVGDRVRHPNQAGEYDIQTGTGRVLREHGKNIAAYRDPQGHLHKMSATCTHAGCQVNWNAVEKSWDCPCHGGRFSATGDVLNGPPTQALKPVQEPACSKPL